MTRAGLRVTGRVQIAGLPSEIRQTTLVGRLDEVLARQSQRGTTKHLADDLRELSARDADEAHDSFALIRIIVWAIPMLGFLGTVIGITQTLGGLDFSDGNAAVDNLKSGLYVAFDTTALGLVLSVLAIFIQFPVEKSEQRLLAEVDYRVGHLTSIHLPSDEPADDQQQLLTHLCDGIRTAVAESLDQQAKLWKSTIDIASKHWAKSYQSQSESIAEVLEHSLTPALENHAAGLEVSATRTTEQLDNVFEKWQNQLHAWQATIIAGAEAMVDQHTLLMQRVEKADNVAKQTKSMLTLQETLALNVNLLEQSSRKIDHNLTLAGGNGMSDAILALARAVDVLSSEMTELKTARQKAAPDQEDQRQAA